MSKPSPSASDPASDPVAAAVCVVTGDQLTTQQLHDLLQLRVDVFVVEQACPYPEIDGRDLRSDTTHIWLPGHYQPPVASYLRVLTEPGQRRIGRVVTHPEARGRHLASALMEEALRLTGSQPVILDAQAYLVDFYRTFSFEPTGPEYVEDGIPHVPMARPNVAPSPPTQSGAPS